MAEQQDQYIVICRDYDPDVRGRKPYVLVTRQVFATREAATRYRATVAKSRKPIVVAGRWGQLRLGAV